MTVIAFDPGFGNNKCAIDGAVSVIPSAVSRPKALGLAAAGMRTADSAYQVETPSGLYAVGDNAWYWGKPLAGLDYSALASEPRLALFYAGLAQLFSPGEYQAELVVGLPVPLLQDQGQAEAVVDQLRAAYKRGHTFRAEDQQYAFVIERLTVVPQPVGAWADWTYNDRLQRRVYEAKDHEVAVLDIGMNTLDLFSIQNTQVLPRFVGGAKVGVRRLLARMNGHGQGVEELDAALRSGRLKPSREILETWLSDILNQVEDVWTDMSRFVAVIPTGGGAVVLGDLLRRALEARGARVDWPEDPITANVRGLWKWGSRNAARRR